MASTALDRIIIRDLLVRGIVGIKPDERASRQDILVNVTMWADLGAAGASDDINDAVNYRSVAKALINHIEQAAPYLVERLATDLIQLCFDADPRIQAVELTVEKPGALRFAKSVGVTLYRRREDRESTKDHEAV
jgi:dihydroneopterin aldolase/D-erythro-7,8-dihydroneopterin triphosphate epimerase